MYLISSIRLTGPGAMPARCRIKSKSKIKTETAFKTNDGHNATIRGGDLDAS
jgi:hypothetical protein